MPVKRRQKKEELPPGWEKHEASVHHKCRHFMFYHLKKMALDFKNDCIIFLSNPSFTISLMFWIWSYHAKNMFLVFLFNKGCYFPCKREEFLCFYRKGISFLSSSHISLFILITFLCVSCPIKMFDDIYFAFLLSLRLERKC